MSFCFFPPFPMKRYASGLLLGLFLFLPLAVHADSLKERLCERVVRRFSDDDKMWHRVNDRVEKRFGYRCTRSAQSRVPTTDARKTLPLTKERMEYVPKETSIRRVVEPIQKRDSSADSLISLYDTSNEYFNYMMGNIEKINTVIRGSVLSLLKTYIIHQEEIGDIAEIALTRNLTDAEKERAIYAAQSINDIQDEILDLVKKYNDIPSYSPPSVPSYSPPSYSPPAKTLQQTCDEMTAKAALSGGFGSSAVSRQMYEMGCITNEKYCLGFSLGGISMPDECK